MVAEQQEAQCTLVGSDGLAIRGAVKLTRREENFVWAVASGGSQTKARIAAGYRDYNCPSRNAQEAYRLAQKPHIADAIVQTRRQYLASLQIDYERVLLEALGLALSNLDDALDAEGNLLPPSEWPANFARCVQSYSEVRITSRRRGTTKVVRKIKLHPKWPALERLVEAAAEARRSQGAGGRRTKPEDVSEDDLAAIADAAQA